MPQNFIPADRDQQLLLPPNLKQWLPEGHLAFFVLDAVGSFDLSGFYGAYRQDGHGRAAFDPAVMVSLLVYAYAIGIRSSREIERRCKEDVAFRVIAANAGPDHATICRFRTRFRAELSELFDEVLRLCAAEGLVRVGVVAVDGTKVAANASRAANRDADGIRREVERMLREAEEIDRQEDELYGVGKRGDELPEHLAVPGEARREHLRRRLEELKEQRRGLEERAAEMRERDELAYRQSHAGRRRGRKPPRPEPERYERMKTNITDPDSRLMSTPTGFVQGYNAQVVVTEDQIAIAADVVCDHNDSAQLEPMLDQAEANLRAANAPRDIGRLLADNGYMNNRIELDRGPEILIAPTSRGNLARLDAPSERADAHAYAQKIAEGQREAQRRAEVLERVERGEIDMATAKEELDVSLSQTYVLRDRYRAGGAEALVSRRSIKPPRLTVNQRMLMAFADDEVQALYRRRASSVEPVFGQIKGNLGVRRFLHRGLEACTSEWRLIVAAHNLAKVWRRRSSASSSPPPARPARPARPAVTLAYAVRGLQGL